MQITIIPPDNRVCVDGNWRTVSMDLPHINAVRFDGERATIEHRPHNGEWLEPAELTGEEFVDRFGHIVVAWQDAPDDAEIAHGTAIPQDQADRIAALEDKLDKLIKSLA